MGQGRTRAWRTTNPRFAAMHTHTHTHFRHHIGMHAWAHMGQHMRAGGLLPCCVAGCSMLILQYHVHTVLQEKAAATKEQTGAAAAVVDGVQERRNELERGLKEVKALKERMSTGDALQPEELIKVGDSRGCC